MATHVLTNAKILVDEFDLTGDFNAVSLKDNAELQENTVFGIGTKRFAGGLQATEFGAGGFLNLSNTANAEGEDMVVFPRVGLAGKIITVSDAGVEGDTAFAFRAAVGEYTLMNASVGEMAKFDLSASSGRGPVPSFGSNRPTLGRGVALANKLGAAQISGNGSGTAFQLGAVTTGKYIWASLHIIKITGGGTLTLILQRDTVGFPSPVTYTTFPSVGVGSAFLQWDATTTTDDYWRANWTLTGASPTAQFFMAAGVQ